MSTPGPAAPRVRDDAIDFVRGVVMILMLLDHTREFTHQGALVTNPLDPATTTPLIYVTRWVTHLCAPAFVLLAGLGVGLKRLGGATPATLARFLWTRGLWLVVLEVAVVRLLVWFNVDFSFAAQLQVIWAIGVSMIALAAIVRLPLAAIATIGAIIVVGHNLLDAVQVRPWFFQPSPLPSLTDKLWFLIHQGGFFPLAGFPSPVVWAHYPLLPWFGILCVGYGLSPLYAWPAERRRRTFILLAIGLACVFVALRSFNIYGDPRDWSPRGDLVKSAMSFFDVTKYGPSLLFTAITLAPTLLALAWLDGRTLRQGLAGAVVTFGRVPLFFYLLQWPTAKLAGMLVTALLGKSIAPYFWNILDLFRTQPTPDIGGPLWTAYLAWAAGVFLLYWPCRWYAGLKAGPRHWWHSYL
jgi:uncharacterized membrane protein